MPPTRATILLFTGLFAAPVALAQNGVIRGRAVSTAGEAVASPSATLLESGRRTVGDSAGQFSFHGVPAGVWRLEVRRIGYRRTVVAVTVQEGEVAEVTVRLEVEPITLRAVTATARAPERERFEDQAQVSTRSLDIRDITAVPSLMESDLLRAVQMLPGVVARNDYSVGINVRGGDADQNLVRLDGQVVFNPFHLGGVVSTFEDDAVRNVDFLAGGFPARYGGRLSSVLDVDERTGSTSGLHGSVSASLLSSKLHLEGPLPKGVGSWLVAARRTYADQLVETFSQSSFPYHFQDLISRVVLPSVLGGVLSLSGFASGDYFDFELTEANSGQPSQHFRFDWGNRTLGATWRRPLGENAVFTQRVGGSGFFADVDVGPGLFRFENRVRRLALEGDVEARLAGHVLAAGYLLERHDIRYAAGSGDLDIALATLEYRTDAVELYAEDQWRPTRQLMLRPGVRLTRIPGGAFGRLAPRLSAKLFLDENTALSAAAGRYYQYVHSLRNEEIPITLFEFWVGTDSAIPVSSADHLVLGVERWFGEGLSVSLEGYTKHMNQLVDGNPEEDPSVRNDEFVTAHGAAHGFDVYLRKSAGRVTGWLSYSYGKVTRTLDESGERYAPAQDRRHTFNAVAAFRGPLRARWTARVGYGSPLPYTGLAGQWIHRFYDPGRNVFIGAFTEPYRNARNSLRYPAYARVDFSLKWQFRWLGGRWSPTVSLLNAGARKNVFVYFYDYTSSPPLRRGFSQFPFFPSVGLEVEF